MEFIDLTAQQKRIRGELDRRWNDVLSHGQYIMGPEVAELEKALASFTGSRHCIAVSSGTDALLLPLMAVGIGPGDEVVVPAFSFFATVEVVSVLGAAPVFVDIDPVTYNMDPEKLGRAITGKTKAVIAVDLYGQCADYERIRDVAGPIPVIEDAAQSFGSMQNGRKACALAPFGATSFFPSKPLGCYGDGGAIFVDDDEKAAKIKRIRIHGQSARYQHTEIGLNARMDTLQAAILLAKLSIFPEEVELRARVAERYSDLLRDHFDVPLLRPGNTSVYAQYTVRVKNRPLVQENLKLAGIPTAVHYPSPLHLQPVFAAKGWKAGDFPVAEKAAEEVVSIPMHPYLSHSDQDKVVQELIRAKG